MRFKSISGGQYYPSLKIKAKYIYFYTDIGKDEYPSEMIFNNRLGTDKIVAKIAKKILRKCFIIMIEEFTFQHKL